MLIREEQKSDLLTVLFKLSPLTLSHSTKRDPNRHVLNFGRWSSTVTTVLAVIIAY